MVAALEFLNQFIQTVNTGLKSLNFEPTIPANMRRFIATIIYCRGRVPIKELDEICKLLQKRYGKELNNLTVDVDGRVSARLTPCIADPNEVEETLQDILKRNNVPYQSAPVMNPLASVLSGPMPGPMPDPMPGPMPNPMPNPMPPMTGPVPPAPSGFPPAPSDFPPAPAFPSAPADGMSSDPFSIPSSMNIPQPPTIPSIPPAQSPDDDIQRRFNSL